jgi:hypothetical protein
MNCCIGLYRSFVQVTILELYVNCDNVLRHFTIHLAEALYAEKKREEKKKTKDMPQFMLYTLYSFTSCTKTPINAAKPTFSPIS